MILAEYTIMKSTRQQLSQRRPARGFTFLEFTVALVVFGITLAGLFPLLVITSRGLQPIKSTSSYNCRSPSRDWGKNAGDDPNMDPSQSNQRHAWQLTPYDDPWLRKLGAGAQTTSSAVASTTPPPIQAPVVYLDDYSGTGPGSNDGTGTFTAGTLNTLVSASSAGYQGDYHFAETLLAVPIVTWRIPVVADGWYSVEATWPTTTALVLTNATYVVTAPNNTPPTLALSPLNQASPGAGRYAMRHRHPPGATLRRSGPDGLTGLPCCRA